MKVCILQRLGKQLLLGIIQKGLLSVHLSTVEDVTFPATGIIPDCLAVWLHMENLEASCCYSSGRLMPSWQLKMLKTQM